MFIDIFATIRISNFSKVIILEALHDEEVLAEVVNMLKRVVATPKAQSALGELNVNAFFRCAEVQ